MTDEQKKAVEDAVKKAFNDLTSDTASPLATGDWKQVLYDLGKSALTSATTLILAYLAMKFGIAQ